MKICPLLWRQSSLSVEATESPEGDRCAPSPGGENPATTPECLGASCRFYTQDDGCGLERQMATLASLEQRLADHDERWESVMLSLVELTERIDSTLTQVEDEVMATAPLTDEEETVAVDFDAARQHNSDGITAYNAGDFERARDEFNQALGIDSEFVEALNNLGLAEMELGNWKEATESFLRAIELNPDLAASYTNLGYVFYLQEDYSEAITMYDKALQRSESSSLAWTNLGNAHFKLGNLEQARHAWSQAVKLDPGNAKAAKNLARIPQQAPA